MPGLIVTDAVRALQEHHPQLTVTVPRTGWDDQTEALDDGRPACSGFPRAVPRYCSDPGRLDYGVQLAGFVVSDC
jgi:hypothetical protein